MALDFWSIIVGGAIGASATASNRWWQYRRDNWIARVDFFCNTINEAADAAMNYWLTAPDPSKDASEETARINGMECKVLGLHTKIDGLFPSLAHRFAYVRRQGLQNRLLLFSDALAGGQFQVKGRVRDTERALIVQSVASEIVVETRKALDHALTFGGLYTFFIEYPAYRR